MNINEYIKKCHELAVNNGWWEQLPENEPGRSEFIADKIDLIASEGAEMVEAMRGNRYADINGKGNDIFKGYSEKLAFKENIKDTFEDELADVFIRTCDIMGFYDTKYLDYGFDLTFSTKEMIRIIRLVSLAYNIEPQIDYLTFCRIIDFCLQIAKNENIDLENHVNMKLEYNKSRGIRHGKEF